MGFNTWQRMYLESPHTKYVKMPVVAMTHWDCKNSVEHPARKKFYVQRTRSDPTGEGTSKQDKFGRYALE